MSTHNVSVFFARAIVRASFYGFTESRAQLETIPEQLEVVVSMHA